MLSRRRLANLGGQLIHVAIRFAEEFTPPDFRTHGVLQQFGRRKSALLYQLVKVVRQVDLHARHTPKYTPYGFSRKRENSGSLATPLRPPNVPPFSCGRISKR